MLLAVHISDGVLQEPVLLGGAVGAVVLLWLGLRGLRDEEIPRIALLTAAIFVSSSIHVPIGPSSAHLLLNGLAGVLLGSRAAVAIPLGLALQAALLGHGGFTSLGVNACVLGLPALACGWLFHRLQALPGINRPPLRILVVAVSGFAWLSSGLYCLLLLIYRLSLGGWGSAMPAEVYEEVLVLCLSPGFLVACVVFAAVSVWIEARLENQPEFALGLLVGELSVLLTLACNVAVLLMAAKEAWDVPVLVLALAHLPIAALEGIVLGFAVGFLARVKPELLGLSLPHNPALDPLIRERHRA